MMKKITAMFGLAVLVSGLLRAQAAPPPPAPAMTTVNGKLALVNGRVALQNGEDLYYVAGIQRLVGFVEGLKEGAQVSLEGYVRDSRWDAKAKVLLTAKLSIGNRSYDLGLGQGAAARPSGKRRDVTGPAPWGWPAPGPGPRWRR
ncbi:MAG: hypothetical protein LBG84_05450 [Treponema sp.]|jgi:hypothetical protein|nr:hypothetical protein [Treponema sp.]